MSTATQLSTSAPLATVPQHAPPAKRKRAEATTPNTTIEAERLSKVGSVDDSKAMASVASAMPTTVADVKPILDSAALISEMEKCFDTVITSFQRGAKSMKEMKDKQLIVLRASLSQVSDLETIVKAREDRVKLIEKQYKEKLSKLVQEMSSFDSECSK